VRASSWLGDQLLADDVPIAAGQEDTDRGLSVPDRVTLTVPRVVDGYDWTPTTDEHPLAANGQTLKLSLGVGEGDAVAWFQRGEFLIMSSAEDGDQVSVTCGGLLTLIDEAKFAAPFQPTGTIGGTLRKLLEPAVTVDLTDSPADRAVPVSAVNWDSDRLGAVLELLDAWPADIRMNHQGYAEVVPDVAPTTAVRAFTNDPATGTIVTAAGSSTRDGGFNIVVATGYAADGAEVRGIATVDSGPWAYGSGPANPLPVPFTYASPLLTTNGAAHNAAATILRRKMRQAVLRRFEITTTPDPTLEVGDAVAITTGDVDELLCTVESLVLPYAPAAMSIKVVQAG
jgi:hypothetical protein